MRQDLRERALFFRSFLAHPRQVGAVLPTSRRTVRDMLGLADLARANLVVELGPGTGVYTAAILDRLREHAQVVALEIDPALASSLAGRLIDPRLRVVHDSAENLEAYLEGRRADVVVSALPFTSLPPGLRRTILERAAQALAPSGVMLIIQYSPMLTRELHRVFGGVRRRLSLLNVPPAFLFACERPLVPGLRDATATR